MADLEKAPPPVSEEVHLPGGSIQPVLITIGITVLLLGVTTSILMVIAGGALTLGTIIRWSLDAKRDIEALPSHAEH